MDAWTATINLGLATTIALIFVTEARIRERRHNGERERQQAWIQDTFVETLDKTTQALTASSHLQGQTVAALTTATDTTAHFALLLQHGVCPFHPTRAQTPEHATRPESALG
jgi:hypothetical protein